MEKNLHHPPRVSISITNMNGKNYCLVCLKSISKLNYPKELLDVMVIDNASTDGSVEEIRKQYPWVRILQQKENIGFAAAVNVGIKNAKGKYTFILSNDENLDKECMLELVKVMELDKKVAIAGAKQYSSKNREKIHFLWGNVDRKTMHIYRVGVGEIDHGQYDTVIVADYVCFTGLVRNSALKQIGYVDERYFFTFEDLDTILRLKQLGYKVVFVPTAKMWHMAGKSLGNDSKRYIYFLTRNNLLIRKKFNGFTLYDHYKNIRFFITSFILSYFGNRRKREEYSAVVRGIFDFYRNKFGQE